MSEYPQGECKSCDELAARIQEMEEALRQLLKQWREPVGKAGGKRAWLKQQAQQAPVVVASIGHVDRDKTALTSALVKAMAQEQKQEAPAELSLSELLSLASQIIQAHRGTVGTNYHKVREELGELMAAVEDGEPRQSKIDELADLIICSTCFHPVLQTEEPITAAELTEAIRRKAAKGIAVGKAGGKQAWLKQKETMGEARGWISTKDQLPPVGVYVLCYHTASTWHSSDQEGVHYRVYMRVKDEYCEAGYRWEEFGPGGKFAEEVTHWMPLPARPADAPPAKEVEARISMTLAEYRSLAIPADEAAQAEVGKLPLMARREWMPAGFNYAGVDPNGRWSFLIGYPGDLLQGCSWFRIADTDEHGLPVIERTSDMPAWAKFIAWDGYDGMAWLYAEMPQRHPWNRVWRMSKGAQPFPVKYPSLRGEFSGRWDKSARRIEDYKGEQSC